MPYKLSFWLGGEAFWRVHSCFGQQTSFRASQGYIPVSVTDMHGHHKDIQNKIIGQSQCKYKWRMTSDTSDTSLIINLWDIIIILNTVNKRGTTNERWFQQTIGLGVGLTLGRLTPYEYEPSNLTIKCHFRPTSKSPMKYCSMIL